MKNYFTNPFAAIAQMKMNSSKFMRISGFALILLISFNCSTPGDKLKQSSDNVIEAEEDLKKAQLEHAEEVKSYREATEKRIAENDAYISDLNLKIENKTSDISEMHRAEVREMERKNNALKAKLKQADDTNKENWNDFKTEFNRDMDELGQAIRNVTTNKNK